MNDCDSDSDRCGAAVEGGPLLYDTFTDANGVALGAHTMDVGPGWTVTQNAVVISGNKAMGSGGYSRAHANAGRADLTCELTGSALAEILTAQLRVDGANPDNCWWAQYYPAGGIIALYEVVAGVPTLRGSAPQAGNANEHLITAFCQGSTISVYFDGVLQFSYALAAFLQTATRFGVRLNNGDAANTLRCYA